MHTNTDRQYLHLPRPSRGFKHQYGDRVFIHSHPFPMSLLTRLCALGTTQPVFNQLIRTLYQYLLFDVASLELRTVQVERPTRMQAYNPEAILRAETIDPHQEIVVADIARAGILPSQVVFDGLHDVMDAHFLRQDHIFMNRATNEKGEVIGVNLSGSKIGGSVAGRTLIIPDPMAATGSSMLATLDLYRNQPDGPPARFIAIHLIVTPEYIRRVLKEAPDIHIHCIRLDRGLSAPDVLKTPFGERPEEERGLNEHDYIVPGGGGFGELINNALT